MTVNALSARAAALDLLQAVMRRRRPLDDALSEHAGWRAMDERDRAFARRLAATALRRLGQIDALIAACLERPLPRQASTAEDVLRLGIAQLVFLGTPAHAAVDTSVSLAQARGAGAHKGLVNAVLRRLAREGEAMAADQDAERLNTPGWLWESWTAAYGETTTRAIARAHLREPPLDITVKGAPGRWAERLGATVLPTGTLRRAAEHGGGPVTALPGFAEGAWWVQDAAAALPARLLGGVKGQRVIDLCAAPGGKTAQLAAAGARVTAVDVSARRLRLVEENLARLGLAAETVCADAAEWRPDDRAGHVLLDAPCTATGALRRHPDVARLKRADDVARLARVQERLLAAAYEMLAPGGVLVFCTCSLQPEEGPGRIAPLLESGAPMLREPVGAHEVGGLDELLTPEGDLRTLPSHLGEQGGLDGFYAVRLRRFR